MPDLLKTKPIDTLDVFVGTGADNWHQGWESQVYGFGGDDHLFSGVGASSAEIWGGRGNDYLQGGIGDDILHGSRGKDTLVGVNGEDRLYGGKGADTFVIYSGNEHFILDYQPGKDVISYVSPPEID